MIWPFGIIGSSSFFFPSSSSSEHVSSMDIVLISIVFADPSPAMDRTGRYSILPHSIIKGWESDMVIASSGWAKNHFWIRIAFQGQRIWNEKRILA